MYYRHGDWLGSSRLATTPTRTKYFDVSYAPFGENYKDSGTTDYSFTGQNQDTMTAYYDFLFREYSQVEGRWLSPDPAGLGVVSPANPQSWNRYEHVLNNPLAFLDSLGLSCEDPHDGKPCVVVVNGGPPPEVSTTPPPYMGCHEQRVEGFDLGCWDGTGRMVVDDGNPLTTIENGGGNGRDWSQNPNPQPTLQHQQCVQAAIDKANDALSDTTWENLKEPFKAAGLGFIDGAIVGCVITFEEGCWEGGVVGAFVGAFGGAIEGTGAAIYHDAVAYKQARAQLKNDIAACPP